MNIPAAARFTDSPIDLACAIQFAGPVFNTDGYNNAAESLTYWVNQYAADISAEDAKVATHVADRPASQHAEMLTELRLFRPTFSRGLVENLITDAIVCEVLRAVTGEVHDLNDAQRGDYVAQLIATCPTPGPAGWLRFRLGHLLAVYFAMLPTTDAFALDPLDYFNADGDELTVLGWGTKHGVFLDLVHYARLSDEHLTGDITSVLADGARLWPDTFEGVRYLPLDDLANARLYTPDG
ncbi:hypothetical protein QWJ41_07010 [Nocardioides sp. SOB44]|jgi:hypothetical protein|uniref:Uncharacterized protein n=1 Tax=Nocardioides cremeus TaxID=3058044 RepID=A0ABT8TNB4_9ACTN|nr:hypothetical protein [Nocardioides cremeus]MDO3395457.1 hypothetical protein [Nocardioides cremeus]